jgi:hypothetical protein
MNKGVLAGEAGVGAEDRMYFPTLYSPPSAFCTHFDIVLVLRPSRWLHWAKMDVCD